LHLPWALIYSGVLLAVIFCAVRRVLIELSLLMTTNVPWVESVLVIAALIFVGILAILALLGLLAKSIKWG
jgi:hypothetical protein